MKVTVVPALVACMILPGAASAQSAEGPSSAQPVTSDGGVGDIVVTARKRNERLQDVPISISAIGSDVMTKRGAIDIKDISAVSAGVFYRSHEQAKPNLYIRGIGTRSYSGVADPSVGTFIDGVYIARFGSGIQDLSDVSRIEVLKGPQGTLFGRNTIGGALNIVTAAPTDVFQAFLGGSYGLNQEFGGRQYDVRGSVSGPIGEGLTGRLSVKYSMADGPSKIVNTGELGNGGGRTTIRGRLNWQPDESLSFDLSGDYFRTNDASFFFRFNDVGGRRRQILSGRSGLVPPPTLANPYLVYAAPGDGSEWIKGGGVSLTSTLDLKAATLTSISAYRKASQYLNSDNDATTYNVWENPYREKSHQFSQELRLASEKDSGLTLSSFLDWTFGFYYFTENVDDVSIYNYGPDAAVVALPPPSGTGGVNILFTGSDFIKTTSYAFFGQVTAHLTESLALDLGLRYSHDRKSLLFQSRTSAPGVVRSNFDIPLAQSWDSIDPAVTLSYKIAPDVLTYAAFSQGFKSGTFQFNPASLTIARIPVAPEKLRSYEAGIKSELFDRQLRLNMAIFRYDYRNIQVQQTFFPTPSSTTTVSSITNGAKSKIYGGEIEGELAASKSLKVNFGLSYLHARYSDYQFTPTVSYDGNVLPRSPAYTAFVAPSLDIPIGSALLTLQGSANYVSHFFFESNNASIGVREPSHTTVDASADLHFGAYSVGVFGRNLGGERIRNSVLDVAGVSLLETWGYRRIIGLRASAQW